MMTSLLLFTFLLSSAYLSSQYSDLHYQQFGMDEGLPTNSVYAVAQDSKGYIWVGTQAGLLRYDGYEFKNYTSEYGLIQNEIIDLRIDSKDRVWMNTTGPLCYFHQDSVYYLDEVGSPNIAWNFDMIEDAKGDLWFSYASKYIKLSGDNLDLMETNKLLSSEGKLLGKIENGVSIFNGNSIINILESGVLDTLELDPSIKIFKKSSAFQWPYLVSMKGESLVSYNLLTRESTTLIERGFQCEDFDIIGDYLIGKNVANGLFIYEIASLDQELDEPDILFPDKTIGGVFIDKDQNIWIPTYKSGLFMIKPISEKVITDHPFIKNANRPLESIMLRENGEMVAGSEDGVFLLYNNAALLERPILEGEDLIKRILDIENCGDEGILLATDQGLFIFHNNSFKQLYTAASKKVDYHDGHCIVSSYNAVFTASLSYLKNVAAPFDANSVFLDRNVNVIERSRSYANSFNSKGEVWYATEQDGLHKLSGNENIGFGKVSNKLKSSIRDIIPIGENSVAVASSGEGVQIITPDDHIVITEESGLSSNIVKCLDFEGDKLYVGTIKGISIVEFGDYLGEYSIQILDKSDGLITEHINDLAVHNDTVYLATHKGLQMVDDTYSSRRNRSERPFLQIDEILVNDEIINQLDGKELEPQQNNIVIRYTGVDVSSPTSLRYAFRMSGINDEWIFTRSRETHYSNLDADTYEFQVGVVTENDIVTDPHSINFVIKEPFIGSDIFNFLALLLLFSVIAFLVYVYNTYLQKSKLRDLVALRTKELGEKMKALEIANSKMEQSNEALRNYAHITSHDLKSPLRSVGSFVQLLQKKNAESFDVKDNEYVKYVRDGVESMENTIDDLLAYSSLEKSEPTRPVPILDVVNQAIVDIAVAIEEKNADIDIQGEFPVLDGHFYRFKRLFQNLIENGLKYNVNAKPVIKITCDSQENEYVFSVSDNGIGLEPKFSEKIFEMFQRLHDKQTYSGTGIGLAMCKKIVESYGGRIWVSSELNEGSTFYFTISK